MYISVNEHRGQLLVRELDGNGKERMFRTKFQPELFIKSREATGEFKTILGEPVHQVHFSSIAERRKYVREYGNIDGMEFYGQPNAACDYIFQTYKNRNYVFDHLRTFFIDIECDTASFMPDGTMVGTGFPKPEEASKPINAITIYDTIAKKYITFATVSWMMCNCIIKVESEIVFHICKDENELLTKLLTYWKSNYPAIVSGFNSDFFDIPYIINRCAQQLGEEETLNLSPWGIIHSRTQKDDYDNDVTTFDIYGVNQLDIKKLYKKYVLAPRESYSLDYLSEIELGETKTKYPCKMFELPHLYPQLFVDYNINDVRLTKMLNDKLNLLQLAVEVSYGAGIAFGDNYSPVKLWDMKCYAFLRNRNICQPYTISNKEKKDFDGAYVFEPKLGRHKTIVSFDFSSLYPSIARQWNISPDTIIVGAERRKHIENIAKLLHPTSPNFAKALLNESSIIDLMVSEGINDDVTLYFAEHKICMTANRQIYKTEFQGFIPALMEEGFKTRKANKKVMMEHKKTGEEVKREIAFRSDPGHSRSNIVEHHNMSVEELKERLAFHQSQEKLYDVKQHAQKVMINALYGALGNIYFRWYMVENASAITSTGQFAIKISSKSVNDYINKTLGLKKESFHTVAGDTDSLYISLDAFDDKFMKDITDPQRRTDFLDGVCKKIEEDCLSPTFEGTKDSYNCREQVLYMDREVICPGPCAGFWTAKKHYALVVYDVEGVRLDKPKLKIMGLPCVQSTTPAYFREKMKETIRLMIMEGEEAAQKHIESVEKDFKSLPVEKIALTKGVGEIEKHLTTNGYYGKGTPGHVKAAANYNRLLNELGLTSKYYQVYEGDKMKYVFLKTPNPIGDTIVGFVTELPEEFNCHKYVDYQKHFEKGYYKAVEDMMELCGWSAVERVSLSSFF